jgi:hypothetical protein
MVLYQAAWYDQHRHRNTLETLGRSQYPLLERPFLNHSQRDGISVVGRFRSPDTPNSLLASALLLTLVWGLSFLGELATYGARQTCPTPGP